MSISVIAFVFFIGLLGASGIIALAGYFAYRTQGARPDNKAKTSYMQANRVHIQLIHNDEQQQIAEAPREDAAVRNATHIPDVFPLSANRKLRITIVQPPQQDRASGWA